MEDWTDKEFLEYVLAHSKTERALFHASYYRRLMKLVGICPAERTIYGTVLDPDGTVTIHHDVAQDLVAVARGEKTVEDITP